MQHFKLENWKIGGLENSIFDVTNSLKHTHSSPFVTKLLKRAAGKGNFFRHRHAFTEKSFANRLRTKSFM